MALHSAGQDGIRPPPLPDLLAWLRQVALQGEAEHLRCLALLDPRVMHPLGNAAGLVDRAAARAEGSLRQQLLDLRASLHALDVEQLLAHWADVLAQPPAQVKVLNDPFETLTSVRFPEILPQLLADLAVRAGDPDWRRVRLGLLGWFGPDHPGAPSAGDAMVWIEGGLVSTHRGEQAEALEALAAYSQAPWRPLTPADCNRLRQLAMAVDPSVSPDTPETMQEVLRALGG